jgi:hypothetical protein
MMKQNEQENKTTQQMARRPKNKWDPTCEFKPCYRAIAQHIG